MKNFNVLSSRINPSFRGGGGVGFTKKQYIGGGCLKRSEAWTVCGFKGAAWQERRGGDFEGG